MIIPMINQPYMNYLPELHVKSDWLESFQIGLISLLSIKGENLITWRWSTQNTYMQARVTYLSGKSFLCEVWDTFIFFKEIKKLITIYYINTSYYHLDVYIIMQTWSPPPFFFLENQFFSYSHISILKLPHPCFFDRVCRMQKVLIFPRWQTYGVKLFLETISRQT